MTGAEVLEVVDGGDILGLCCAEEVLLDGVRAMTISLAL